MTPTRSGCNYSIQSEGSGPGHSSHKSERQECQPRGEAQMENDRTSTSFQRLASTFDTLIESPEAEITAVAVIKIFSFIIRQLKELRRQVQNLESSTGHHADLFQEQLEKSDKERHELKEDIQSSIHNISLKNDLPRQYTPILHRNVLNLNNDLHTTISSNAEMETACNFKDSPRLEEWPTFGGEGEYKHMEFMKTIHIVIFLWKILTYQINT
ncbi:hypothetical protein O181_118770 [Austropuccinia psidii MF-1]|uniref:Uncharacterized protein n=1 Tax=Austropuccinia psidii MF-1 TaxID=1389203 RepID=A0A9Q3KH10_9BASI|nr:hypothetical protein [Austropuccinia psidii MF-1]